MKTLAEMAELLKKRWNQSVRDAQTDKRESESSTVRNCLKTKLKHER